MRRWALALGLALVAAALAAYELPGHVQECGFSCRTITVEHYYAPFAIALAFHSLPFLAYAFVGARWPRARQVARREWGLPAGLVLVAYGGWVALVGLAFFTPLGVWWGQAWCDHCTVEIPSYAALAFYSVVSGPSSLIVGFGLLWQARSGNLVGSMGPRAQRLLGALLAATGVWSVDAGLFFYLTPRSQYYPIYPFGPQPFFDVALLSLVWLPLATAAVGGVILHHWALGPRPGPPQAMTGQADLP